MAKKNRSFFSRRRRKASARKAKNVRRSNLRFESLEDRRVLATTTLTFQEGLNSYTGTEDTVLFSQAVDSNFGSESAISVDQQDANGVRQGLLQYRDLFGDSTIGFSQIPEGSNIVSATLSFEITNPSTSQAQMSLYRMLQPWSESTATWNSFGSIGGVQASEGESTDLPPDFTLFDPRRTSVLGADEPVDDPDRVPGDPGTFDVTRSLQSWSSGETDNNGWLIESTATDGWDLSTSENSQNVRPFLRVTFTAPDQNEDTIRFVNTEVVQAEGDTGSTQVALTVSRLGGNGGTDTVSFTVADGTAEDAGTPDDYDPVSTGTVSFAPGEVTKTILVDVNGDTVLEGNEDFTVTLNSVTVGDAVIDGSNDVATVTIADDDALINEVLANVSVVGGGSDETDREYVELIGTPGASLSGYYFVVFEGQEEEAGGTDPDGAGPLVATGSGVADLVVDLSGQTFGSNGLLVLRPTTWDYSSAAGSNELIVPDLGTLNGLEDDSQTYALVRSSVAPVQGTDYDVVGNYVGAARDAVDSPLGEIGLLDVAPFTSGGAAQIVDSVSVFNGGSDRDRAIVTGDLGLPGVHVHQPTRTLSSADNVASDAVSRLEGNFLPNTIGAWFNGDITDQEADDFGVDVIEYLNGTTQISAVAPDGSVLTPGAPNILNNVFITADVVSIDEPAAGTANVTFTVTRTGDLSNPLAVNYQTVDGSAVGGLDFVAQPAGVVNFTATGASTQTEQITVVVNSDVIAEGFEDFSVQLTSAATPFLITGDTASVRINDGDVIIADFQQGAIGTQGGGSYSGTEDTYIDSEPGRVNTVFGINADIRVDDAEGGDFTGGGEGVDIRPQQGLISFDSLFGAAGNQVPAGAQIFGATLTLFVTGQSDSTATINFHRMLGDWTEAATWNNPQQGIGGGTISEGILPDDVEAAAIADFSVPAPAAGGFVEIPLNIETVQAWANGSIDNFGWVAISDSGSLWEFASSETGSVANRPKLTLQYTDPTGQAGQFAFAQREDGSSAGMTNVKEGNTADVIVQRVGGSTGAASVDYTIAFDTASSGDIGTPSPSTTQTTGTVSFAAGELFKTISIPTIGDSTAEVNETLNITLTPNVGGVLGQADELKLTIRDDDSSTTSPPVLVSEIVYNQPGNDGASEMFELTGTPNAPLGSFYAVVIAGDTGEDQGATDLVVNLGSFSNGSNGTTLIGAETGFNWDVPAGTTFVGIPELDSEFLGGADNGTSTYALIYSPETPLFEGRFDYDVDNNGVTLDLPAGAVIVDSIGIQDTDATVANDDTTYGGVGNTFDQPFGTGDAIDGVSRLAGNTTRNSSAAWFAGDLIGSNDALVYDWRLNGSGFAESINLPQDGAAATPGLVNNVANPAITVTSVTQVGGIVTVTFSGDVDQVLEGDGTSFTGDFGPGISVTDTSGNAIPGIDAIPSVSGIGSNTLTLSFTGASTSGGALPAGNYDINFSGNSIVAEGRALDANLAGAVNNASTNIDVVALDADFDGDGLVTGLDFLAWQVGFGTAAPNGTNADGDADGDQDVDNDDLTAWENAYGSSFPVVAAISGAGEAPAAVEAVEAPAAASLPANTIVTLPGQAEIVAEAPVADAGFVAVDAALSADVRTEAAYSLDSADSLAAADDVDSTDEAFADFDAVFAAV